MRKINWIKEICMPTEECYIRKYLERRDDSLALRIASMRMPMNYFFGK